MPFLISLISNPKAIAALIISIIAFAAGWKAHSIITSNDVANAVAAQVEECKKAQAITSEVSKTHEDKITALNNRVAGLKRLQSTRCVPITKPTGERHDSTSGTEPVRANGVNAGELIDFAAEAEKYRLQLISCQDFVRKERK